MRSVAPDSPGIAASQNSWSVVNLKPTAGSLATTTDHTIQTAKASSSAGIEIHRLRRAIARPFSSQNCWILRPPVRRARGRRSAPTCFSLVDRLHFRELAAACRARRLARLALHAPDREMHPDERHGDDQEQQHEAAGPDAGQIVEHAEGDRQHEAAEAADHADQAADRRRHCSGSRPGCACRPRPCPGS